MAVTRHGERGQAAVEAALTLPLTLFLILGTMQLFLMLQARLMAEHAAFRATRAGALSQGSCTRMLQAAITTLLPTFARTDTPARLANAFGGHKNNQYNAATDGGLSGDIVWLIRPSPVGSAIPAADDETFDDPDLPLQRLEVRLVFWYPMRIPFANWVIARMVLAAWGLQSYTAANPLMETQRASWSAYEAPPSALTGAMQGEFVNRSGPNGTYVFPIVATAAMRMMTPPRAAFFNPQDCR
jgi:hypothetical protein